MQVVVGHANPDLDAYAATVAATKLFPGSVGVFLGSQNDNVREFHNLHQDFLNFIELKELDLDAVTRLVMVDTRDAGRIGELGRVATRPGVEVVVYDHHPTGPGDLAGVEDRSRLVGATTSILVHEIRGRGVALTPLEASVMLLGIHEDTGSLTYPGSTAYDADAVAYLMAVGADMEVLNQFLVRTLTPAQQGLLDRLIASLETWRIHGQEVVVGRARLEEYVDSASVVTHYIVEDMGYRVAFAAVDMPDRLHVVGRSRLTDVDVGRVLGHLGGGGHPQAASAALKDADLDETLAELRRALETEVRPPLAARDILSAPVRTVTPEETMRQAGEVMAAWGHGGLPVVEEGRLVGLVTRKDFDKARRHKLDHAPVKGFMARDVVAVSPETDLGELERLMAQAGIGRVPVVEDGRLVGIVTRKDLLRAEHGDAYLDRRLPQATAESSQRFLASVEDLLPTEARESLHALGEVADDLGVRAYVVGGFVRDMLLGRANLDVDVVVEGDGVAFGEEAGRRLGHRVRAHRRFGTAVLIVSRELHVDIASARTEYYTRPGALPTVERSSLRQDLLRRDFSINAMAACINPECFGAVADPFGGYRDVRRGVVRVLHTLSFVEDPTRVLRAARFEERYGFRMDAHTEALAREAVQLGVLEEVSGARVREELMDLIEERPADPAFTRLAELGALSALLPDDVEQERAVESVRAAEGAYAALAEALPAPPKRRTALLVALGGAASVREADKWLRRLRLGREHTPAVRAASERGPTVLRRLRDRRGMRDSRLNALLAPLPPETLVWLLVTGDEVVRERVTRYAAVLAHVRAAVTGDDLVAMGFEPSSAFSDILAQALADRLDERAVGREAELENLRRLALKAGLRPRDQETSSPR
ncbi:MAG: CBS domain-containing protein [Coriobacteriia bacterium]|nr:CBS domain-containing protein [Coriobacteriia bacterium]